MTRGQDMVARSARRAAMLSLLVLAGAAQAAPAGPVSDYQLPPGPAPAPPPVQGPVDSDAPSARPTAPAPQASAQPTPRVVLPTFGPSPAARAPRQTPRPSDQVGQQSPAPAAFPTASDTPAPQTSASVETPQSEAGPLVPDTSASSFPWTWAALAVLGIVAILAGLVWWRGRRRTEAYAPESPAEAAPPDTVPAPSAPAALPPVTVPKAAPAPPADPTDSTGIQVQLEASQLSRSLVYATLAYRLILTNRGDEPTAPARILADLISAHASLAAHEQLSLDAVTLDPKHDIPALAPGETLTVSGDLRMAVATIRPIMQAGAALFVPLARFRIESAGGRPDTDHVFVVGIPAEQPGGALKPLRIDSLPGVVRPLDQRRVSANAA